MALYVNTRCFVFALYWEAVKITRNACSVGLGEVRSATSPGILLQIAVNTTW